MKRIAILGGGPAGAFAAEQLASAGLSVVLMDEKLAWEKPCGGGLTYKAYSQYPFLIEKTRVNGMARQGGRWILRTAGGTVDADFCIVATGARNPLREVGTQLT